MIEFIKCFKIIFTTCFLSISNFSFAANYYVAVAASGDGSGVSASNESATIQNIFDTYDLASGDSIYVAAGTYTEKGIVVGSDDEGFTIQGAALYGGVPTTIFDSDQTDGWLYLGNANNDNITINNIYVKDYMETTNGSNYGGSGIRIIDGCTGLTINRTFFDNCDAPASARGGAIHVIASTVATTMNLTDVSFFNCYAPNQGGAFLIEASSDYDVNMTRCRFYANTSNASSGSAIYYSGAAGSLLTMVNCLAYENTLSGNNHGNIYIHTNADANLINCTIVDNVSPASYTGGVYFAGSGSTLVNCILYGNTYRDIYRSTGTITVDHCFYGAERNCTVTNSSTTDPLFTNPAVDDYTLQATSTAINFGTTTDAPTDDILSYTRTVLPDAGAFEYGGAAPLPISLVDFKASLIGRDVLLTWSTFSERNNDYFSVEKTYDGKNFSIVGYQNGSMNSNSLISYSLYDFNVENSLLYYRLKQTDFDGQTTYSKLISIDNRGMTDKKIVGVFNMLGQEIDETYKGLIIVVYSDGTSIKQVK
jgi:hypothetical protein